MRLLDDFIGKEIIDINANVIGKVTDVEIDAASNKIDFIIATKKEKKSNFMSSKEEEEKIPYEMILTVGDKIILKDPSDTILNF